MRSVDAEIIRKFFFAFVLHAFRETHDQSLGTQPYVRHLCHEISKLLDGQTTRLLINLPPQHLKTFICSICLAAYLLGKNPRLRILLTTYDNAMAENLCEKIRELMQSSWYKEVFPTRIKSGHSRTNDFATEQNGGVFAASATGAVTGRPADVVIYDDPLEIGDWNNEKKLTLVRDNFNTLLSRLHNKLTGRIIVVAHRLNTQDLSSTLLDEPDWTCVRLPLVAVETRDYDLGNNLVWTRPKGDILRPDAYSDFEIERLARTQLAPPYELFYQQGLDPGISRAVQREDFQSFAPKELPLGPIVLSIDPGFSAGPTASRTVIQAWKCSNTNFYLVDQYCEPCDAETFRHSFWKFVRKYNPSVALIEATANGPALYARIRNKARFEIRLITPRRASKTARFNDHVEKIRAKRVFLPMYAPWRHSFLDEITNFPGEFDDQIDAMTQYFDFADTDPTIKPPRARAIVARPTLRLPFRKF